MSSERMCTGLEDAEFSIPGVIVADIGLAGRPPAGPTGRSSLTIEALTVATTSEASGAARRARPKRLRGIGCACDGVARRDDCRSAS